MHNYQPTAEDIAKIGMADVFIYVGGESDAWVEDVLEEAGNKELKVVNLMEAVGNNVKTEELVEGMQESKHEHAEHEEGEHAEHEEDSHEEHEHEYDEHIWLSLKNASVLVAEISDTLQSVATEDFYYKAHP